MPHGHGESASLMYCCKWGSLPTGSRSRTPATVVTLNPGKGRPLRQAALTRVDDGVDAVADAQLGEDPADVGLDGPLGDHQPAGDGGRGDGTDGRAIRRSTSVSRVVSVCRAASGSRRRTRILANSATRRRVTVGASSACPAAATRTASKRRSAVASLSRKPSTRLWPCSTSCPYTPPRRPLRG